jgi:hypothetical protein
MTTSIGQARWPTSFAISKKLNWTLLHRVGQCSVFDTFDGHEPAYMARRSDPAHPDLCGWYSGKELQQRLQAALAAQSKRR